MTYTVSSGTLNPSIPYHTITRERPDRQRHLVLVFHLHGVVDALLIHVLRPMLIVHTFERCLEHAMTETQSTCGVLLADHDQYGTANLIDGHQRRRATDDRSRDEGRGEVTD